jgi:hypothetical protein
MSSRKARLTLYRSHSFSGILQEFRHGLWYFARKRLISISRESASFETARAKDIVPRRALKVKIALGPCRAPVFAWKQSGNQLNAFRICSEASAGVRLSLRAISGASALNAQPVPGLPANSGRKE